MIKKIHYLLVVALLLTACQDKQLTEEAVSTEPSLLLSHLSGPTSQNQVKESLVQALDPNSVNLFLTQVSDYNTTVKAPDFVDNFTQTSQPIYNIEQLDQEWIKAKGDFIGMNCRLTTYTLLKNSIQIPDETGDPSLLFFDLEAIQTGNLLNQTDSQQFQRLFGRVQTVASQDEKVHAEKMSHYLSAITFSEKASMVSLVIHDNLDGDSLFIGHTGVLVPHKKGYLFLEKLSFQEPYQFIQFSSKNEVFHYLRTKYAHYGSADTAKPFIMENATYIPE